MISPKSSSPDKSLIEALLLAALTLRPKRLTSYSELRFENSAGLIEPRRIPVCNVFPNPEKCSCAIAPEPNNNKAAIKCLILKLLRQKYQKMPIGQRLY